MLNKVLLIGRITADPVMPEREGFQVCNFNLAVDMKNEKTSFISCVAFDKVADSLVTYVKKGNRIAVEGYLNQRTYKASDNTNRSVTEVICESIEFLEKKPEETTKKTKR